MRILQICLGNEIALGGYVWSFPNGYRLASVGVCIQGSKSAPGLAAKLLKDLTQKRVQNARIMDFVIGAVLASGPIETTISDGVMLVGNATKQLDLGEFSTA